MTVDENRRAALSLEWSDGLVAINVSASGGATMWNKQNIAVRDEAVARISSAIA